MMNTIIFQLFSKYLKCSSLSILENVELEDDNNKYMRLF